MGAKGLPYYGGKSPGSGRCKWIVGLLGYEKARTYIEPFGGMLGVLCARPRAKVEIVNDLDGNLVNWWLCIRKSTDEMVRRIMSTPWSREVFWGAAKLLDGGGGTAVDRAVAFHVIVEQGLRHCSAIPDRGEWGIRYRTTGTFSRWRPEHFQALAERLYYVQVEHRPADEILERASGEAMTTVYCDPPYPTTDRRPYAHEELDKDRFLELFRVQKGHVAISGYGDEWDVLGFYRYEYETTHSGVGEHVRKGARARTEVLWTNFEPRQPDLFGGSGNG